MNWSFFPYSNAPEEALESWNKLNIQVTGNGPALDHRFLRLLAKFFGDGSELLGICSDKNECIAAALVRPLNYGVWTMFVPGQACLSPLLIPPGINTKEVMSSLITALPGFCWLLRMPKVDPRLQPVDELAKLGTTDIDQYGTTYSIDLGQRFDHYWASRSKNLRRQLRKAMEAIEARGAQIKVEFGTDRDSISNAIVLHGKLESLGWKGKAGTAIHGKNEQGAFYKQLLKSFSATDDAITAQLYLDGQLAASLICVGANGTVIQLKTTYEQKLANLSPGRLLDFFFLKKYCGSGKYQIAEMYTKASQSDLSWATNHREWFDINLYRTEILKVTVELAKRAKLNVRNIAEKNPNGFSLITS